MPFKNILGLVGATLLVPLSIVFASPDLDFSKQVKAFDRAVILKNLPKMKDTNYQFAFDGVQPKYNETNEDIPEPLRQRFIAIQRFVFGKDLFKLGTCGNCLSFMDLTKNKMKVFINPQLIETLVKSGPKDSDEVLDFILTHEISHYIYECFVKINGGMSLFGQKSIIYNSSPPQDILDSLKLLKVSPQDARRLLIATFVERANRHAEVDAIAATIYTQMGKGDLNAVPRWFLSVAQWEIDMGGKKPMETATPETQDAVIDLGMRYRSMINFSANI